MIVLDTNVISEIWRPEPEPGVLAWLEAQPSDMIFTTTVTQAEILYGIAIMPSGHRQRALHAAITAMFSQDFAGRVLSFDTNAASAYADIAAARRATGRPISQFDTQIASIARVHGAELATRNTADFQGTGVPLINPWDAP